MIEMNEIKTLLAESRAAIAAAQTAVSERSVWLDSEAVRVTNASEELAKQLEQCYQDCAVGHTPYETLLDVKRSMAAGEEFLNDLPQLREGLEMTVAKIKVACMVANALEGYFNKYQLLQNVSQPTLEQQETLRSLPRHIETMAMELRQLASELPSS